MPDKERIIATLPGVRAAVKERQLRVYGAARSRFAKHDHPGGIRLNKRMYDVDGWVYLEGEGATPFELGHIRSGAYARKMGPNVYVPGAHVMGQAARD